MRLSLLLGAALAAEPRRLDGDWLEHPFLRPDHPFAFIDGLVLKEVHVLEKEDVPGKLRGGRRRLEESNKPSEQYRVRSYTVPEEVMRRRHDAIAQADREIDEADIRRLTPGPAQRRLSARQLRSLLNDNDAELFRARVRLEHLTGLVQFNATVEDMYHQRRLESERRLSSLILEEDNGSPGRRLQEAAAQKMVDLAAAEALQSARAKDRYVHLEARLAHERRLKAMPAEEGLAGAVADESSEPAERSEPAEPRRAQIIWGDNTPVAGDITTTTEAPTTTTSMRPTDEWEAGSTVGWTDLLNQKADLLSSWANSKPFQYSKSAQRKVRTYSTISAAMAGPDTWYESWETVHWDVYISSPAGRQNIYGPKDVSDLKGDVASVGVARAQKEREHLIAHSQAVRDALNPQDEDGYEYDPNLFKDERFGLVADRSASCPEPPGDCQQQERVFATVFETNRFTTDQGYITLVVAFGMETTDSEHDYILWKYKDFILEKFDELAKVQWTEIARRDDPMNEDQEDENWALDICRVMDSDFKLDHPFKDTTEVARYILSDWGYSMKPADMDSVGYWPLVKVTLQKAAPELVTQGTLIGSAATATATGFGMGGQFAQLTAMHVFKQKEDRNLAESYTFGGFGTQCLQRQLIEDMYAPHTRRYDELTTPISINYVHAMDLKSVIDYRVGNTYFVGTYEGALPRASLMYQMCELVVGRQPVKYFFPESDDDWALKNAFTLCNYYTHNPWMLAVLLQGNEFLKASGTTDASNTPAAMNCKNGKYCVPNPDAQNMCGSAAWANGVCADATHVLAQISLETMISIMASVVAFLCVCMLCVAICGRRGSTDDWVYGHAKQQKLLCKCRRKRKALNVRDRLKTKLARQKDEQAKEAMEKAKAERRAARQKEYEERLAKATAQIDDAPADEGDAADKDKKKKKEKKDKKDKDKKKGKGEPAVPAPEPGPEADAAPPRDNSTATPPEGGSPGEKPAVQETQVAVEAAEEKTNPGESDPAKEKKKTAAPKRKTAAKSKGAAKKRR